MCLYRDQSVRSLPSHPGIWAFLPAGCLDLLPCYISSASMLAGSLLSVDRVPHQRSFHSVLPNLHLVVCCPCCIVLLCILSICLQLSLVLLIERQSRALSVSLLRSLFSFRYCRFASSVVWCFHFRRSSIFWIISSVTHGFFTGSFFSNPTVFLAAFVIFDFNGFQLSSGGPGMCCSTRVIGVEGNWLFFCILFEGFEWSTVMFWGRVYREGFTQSVDYVRDIRYFSTIKMQMANFLTGQFTRYFADHRPYLIYRSSTVDFGQERLPGLTWTDVWYAWLYVWFWLGWSCSTLD